MKWWKRNCRSCLLVAIAILFIAADVAGQDGINELKPDSMLDEIFIFRAVLTGLLTILIWVAKATDKRLSQLEEFSKEAREKRVDGFLRLQALEEKWQIVLHEQKELASMIGIQRELMLTQYMDKDAIEKHWHLVEGTLKEHSGFLRLITIQLETAKEVRASRRKDDG